MEYDSERVISCMFEPVTADIIARLEDGPQELGNLAAESGMSQEKVLEQLSYLIQHGFILRSGDGPHIMLSADGEKLASAVEGSGSFDGAVSGLETMDGYLN